MSKIYDSLNLPVIDMLPTNSSYFLDVGCGGGALGFFLRQTRAAHVTGVTSSTGEAQLAEGRLDRIIIQDLDFIDVTKFDYVDCVICSHVLEHLKNPDAVLLELKKCLKPDGRLVVALPNVLHWRQRIQFLIGHFRYADGGIMDRTHLRFYDWQTAEKLILDAGYVIESKAVDGHFPGVGKLGEKIAKIINTKLSKIFPGLIGHQFIFRAKVE